MFVSFEFQIDGFQDVTNEESMAAAFSLLVIACYALIASKCLSQRGTQQMIIKVPMFEDKVITKAW